MALVLYIIFYYLLINILAIFYFLWVIEDINSGIDYYSSDYYINMLLAVACGIFIILFAIIREIKEDKKYNKENWFGKRNSIYKNIIFLYIYILISFSVYIILF